MTRRVRWTLIAVLAAVVAGGAVLALTMANRPASARDAALDYLQALASGAAAEVRASGIEASEDALAAFEGATALIEDAQVTEVEENGDTAAATVSFRLDGDAHEATLPLSHRDGRWVVGTAALGTLSAETEPGAFVAVGDAVFAVGDEQMLLPARYPVSAAPAALLSGEAAVDILPGESTSVAVEAQLRAEATDAAQKLLDDHLTGCAAEKPQDGTPPAGCGIRIPWGTEFAAVDGIRFRIEQLPDVELSATSFRADGGVLVATVTGTGQDGAPRTTTYRTDSWSVRGDVAFTADGVELSVW